MTNVLLKSIRVSVTVCDLSWSFNLQVGSLNYWINALPQPKRLLSSLSDTKKDNLGVVC